MKNKPSLRTERGAMLERLATDFFEQFNILIEVRGMTVEQLANKVNRDSIWFQYALEHPESLKLEIALDMAISLGKELRLELK